MDWGGPPFVGSFRNQVGVIAIDRYNSGALRRLDERLG